MFCGANLVSVWVKVVLAGAAVFLLYPFELLLLRSIGVDVANLYAAFGYWALAIFVAPTVAMLVWSYFHRGYQP
jgi:hypothetical protein